MPNKDILEKEIDLIQACINRMVQYSFMIKGWMISLVAIIIALLPEKIDLNVRILCVVAFVVTLCFWYLDGFFLKTERLYRWKYAWVIKNRPETLEFVYDLNPHNSKTWIGGDKEPNIICVMFSRTLNPLYLLMTALEVLIFLNSIFGLF